MDRQAKYLWDRLAGATSDRTDYILTIEDDCQRDLGDYVNGDADDGAARLGVVIMGFTSLDGALHKLRKIYAENTPCPEHARILVWEVLPSGHRKVVWHFSGWHYFPEYYTTLPQGALPGDKVSLYSRALEEDLGP